MSFHDWIIENIPVGETILELGSGEGTKKLADYDMYSIEDNYKFVGVADNTNYIYAPIKNGWYDRDCMRFIMNLNPHVFIVDGPAGKIGRKGLLKNMDIIRYFYSIDLKFIICDDVNRKKDLDLYRNLEAEFPRGESRIYQEDEKSFGVISL